MGIRPVTPIRPFRTDWDFSRNLYLIGIPYLPYICNIYAAAERKSAVFLCLFYILGNFVKRFMFSGKVYLTGKISHEKRCRAMGP
jgi:hypothetical protein